MACEALGRVPGKKQRNEHGVVDGPPEPTVSLPSPRRGERRHIGMLEAAVPAQTPDEVDILHQRQLSVSSQLLKNGPPYKQCLVAVGQVEQADANPDTPFNPARPACWRIQREAKTAADDPRLFVEAAQRVNPTHPQPRVGVQEHEPSAARVARAVVHLRAAARRGSHPSHARIPLAQGIQSRIARLAAVHDDDLEGGIGGQRGQQRRERRRVVQHRDHDGDRRLRVPAG